MNKISRRTLNKSVLTAVTSLCGLTVSASAQENRPFELPLRHTVSLNSTGVARVNDIVQSRRGYLVCVNIAPNDESPYRGYLLELDEYGRRRSSVEVTADQPTYLRTVEEADDGTIFVTGRYDGGLTTRFVAAYESPTERRWFSELPDRLISPRFVRTLPDGKLLVVSRKYSPDSARSAVYCFDERAERVLWEDRLQERISGPYVEGVTVGADGSITLLADNVDGDGFVAFRFDGSGELSEQIKLETEMTVNIGAVSEDGFVLTGHGGERLNVVSFSPDGSLEETQRIPLPMETGSLSGVDLTPDGALSIVGVVNTNDPGVKQMYLVDAETGSFTLTERFYPTDDESASPTAFEVGQRDPKTLLVGGQFSGNTVDRAWVKTFSEDETPVDSETPTRTTASTVKPESETVTSDSEIQSSDSTITTVPGFSIGTTTVSVPVLIFYLIKKLNK